MKKAAYQAKQSILCYPHTKLSEISREITTTQIRTPIIQGAIRKLCEAAMLLNLRSFCAPKMSFPYRIILLRNSSTFEAYISPKVVETNDQKYGMWENCVSLDAVTVWLLRSRSITVEAWSEDGQEKISQLSGLSARLFLHEMEHLNGECILTRAESRDFMVTSDALLQKKLWDPNFPSPEAFSTPLFSYYDFSLARVVKVPELSSEANAFNHHFMRSQSLGNSLI